MFLCVPRSGTLSSLSSVFMVFSFFINFFLLSLVVLKYYVVTDMILFL